jgi:hypothetical protein
MLKPIHLKEVRINGMATSNVEKGVVFPVLVRAELTSDQPEFHQFMQSVSNLVASRARDAEILLILDRVSFLLLVTHNDGTADLYLQDIPISLEILAKRDVNAGEAVYQSGVADVRRLQIPGLALKPDDGVLMCFKVGWKFALFFDLAPNRSLDVDKMERSLGRLYRRLSFQGLYEAFGDEKIFSNLVSTGWFPFVEIIGGEFEVLLKALTNNFNVVDETNKLLKKFDATRIDEIGQRWWKRPSLINRKEILEPALEAFKRGDSVACLKIILTEIEGIIQESYVADLGHGVSIKELLAYAADKGVKKAGDETSLLFPHQFLRYMSDYTYSYFDPKNPKGDVVSRHSVGHGGASATVYTRERALQAILTLDQVSFYL